MKRHIAICLLSVGLASGSYIIAGGWQSIEKLLHRWSFGVSVIFEVLFTIAFFLSLRGGISRSFWVIPINAVLAYFISIISYILYFSLFEPERLLSTLSHISISNIGMALLIMPAFMSVWLFGAVAGAVSFFLERIFGAWGNSSQSRQVSF